MTAGDLTSVINQIARSYNTKLRNWYHHRLRTNFHIDNLPSVCIVEQCQHFVCVKDGAIYDSWDSRGKTKKLKEVKSVWCSDNVWNDFMTKHNGDLRAAGVVK